MKTGISFAAREEGVDPQRASVLGMMMGLIYCTENPVPWAVTSAALSRARSDCFKATPHAPSQVITSQTANFRHPVRLSLRQRQNFVLHIRSLQYHQQTFLRTVLHCIYVLESFGSMPSSTKGSSFVFVIISIMCACSLQQTHGAPEPQKLDVALDGAENRPMRAPDVMVTDELVARIN